MASIISVPIGSFWKEGDEVPGQDRIQLVDAIRRGRKPLQLAPAFFLCLHDAVLSMSWAFTGIVASVEADADPKV
jgi:hypothetical protein